MGEEFTFSWTDTIVIKGVLYSKKQLCLDWFRMSNDLFFQEYGFNFNPRRYNKYNIIIRDSMNGEEKHFTESD